MSVSAVRVACVQVAPVVGDLASNRRLTREAVREAVGAGARLVVLPELSTSGYVFESPEEARACAEPADGPSLAGWSEEAARGGAVVVGGFCELGEYGRLYNAAAVVDGGGVLGVYRKIHLWDRERLFFEPGSECAPVLDTAVGRVGVGICYDLNFPEVARGLALAGADVVVLPSNLPRFPRPEGERPIEVTLAMATAHLNHVFVALCDRCGPERGVEWVGGSVVCDEWGWILAGPPPGFGPGLVVADCEFGRARDKAWNERNDVFGDRRPDLYRLGDPASVA
ncbi:MAG TPA: nitrilase-related carbon-nitrogen hydrolase [Gaiellaceae bacterium]|nr:nitrilase-related carbon-nitrogen hydrolase [Gaiellaceae bacterium]